MGESSLDCNNITLYFLLDFLMLLDFLFLLDGETCKIRNSKIKINDWKDLRERKSQLSCRSVQEFFHTLN